MHKLALVFIGLAVAATNGQRAPATTPVPILRQINTHNDDGSYTYGYEAADGSYKIETKGSNGEVKGKYGYYDDTGMLREIEYGASRNGFSPSGTGIKVPAPVISNNQITSTNPGDYDDGSYRPGQYDEGQYRPDLYDEGQYRPSKGEVQYQQPAAPSRFANARNFAPAPGRSSFQPSYYQPQAQPQPQQPAYQPISLPAGAFNGHPARNIDLNTGSYSLSFAG